MTASTINRARSRRFELPLFALAFWPACSGNERALPVGSTTTGGVQASANAGAGRGPGGAEATSQSGAPDRAGGGGSLASGNGGRGDDDAAGAPPSDGGASTEGGANAEGGAGRTGGSAGSGSGGAAAGAGPEMPIGVCAGVLSTVAPRRLEASTALADQFGGITPDERVIAWTTSEGNVVELLTAEREDPEQAFGPVRVQSIPAVPDRVTISPDGLRIVYVNADRRGFSVLSREALGEAFAPSQAFEFSLLNEPDVLRADESYGDPVLSGSDLAFVYSRFGESRAQTLFITGRFSRQAPWQAGHELSIVDDFVATAGDRFQPTGLTADELTLFLWHATETLAYALQFDTNHLQFELHSELGPLAGATPNRDCTRVYYDSAGGSSDLFVAELR